MAVSRVLFGQITYCFTVHEQQQQQQQQQQRNALMRQ